MLNRFVRADRSPVCLPIRLVSSYVLCILLLAWAGCGGGGNNGSATLFSLGGTLSGLAGTGLILQNNGADNSPVTANGAFALTSPIAKNSSYVQRQRMDVDRRVKRHLPTGRLRGSWNARRSRRER